MSAHAARREPGHVLFTDPPYDLPWQITVPTCGLETVGYVRIAVITESYEPTVNGVTGSVRHLLPELAALGHDVVVLAPGRGPTVSAGFPVVRLPALSAPAVYRSVPIGLPMTRRIEAVLREFEPDVVHLAAPTVFGAAGAVSARRIGVPAVAIFQTDLAGFARHYGLGWTGPAVWAWLRHVHTLADRTLVPSSATRAMLGARGFERLAMWPRGVDLDQFTPSRRDEGLRRALGAPDRVLVGYVGRVAAEKRIDLLPSVAALPGVRLVVVGTGPAHPWLRRRTPSAAHLGWRDGTALGTAVSSLDVLVAPGADETFCQSVQEALAAGVPVVAAAAGGPLDLVRHGHNGLLVTPGSARQLALAVGELTRRRELRRTLASRARPSVADRSWRTVTLMLLDHLADAAGLPARLPADRARELAA